MNYANSQIEKLSAQTLGGRQDTRGEITKTIESDQTDFQVDADGFLLDHNQYCEAWANHVREQEGIAELTEEHRSIIKVARNYYSQYGVAPMARVLSKITNIPKQHIIYEIFPSGFGSICKMAGLPKPTCYYLTTERNP
ncbi:TusE/DsrC/DsvC family sulfur relay protein [Candidatus Gracilibacteria bacterium]|nr:TusE/DsrC/DsvC family sulfur relay protein [Candidatus Gracilibacteria bacterium]MCF7856461.1 TusE/DsrC/DsvC family sulfur relay protein [Candidatus Gracilibacteria bacterium]MCF7896757.1 TusE/DsrC/DsvC family sulfur relay protein [Candidatus Gracilibacteria bacterium]